MHLPPICRRINYEEEHLKIKEALDKYLSNEVSNDNYLKELKERTIVPRSFPRTLRIE